MTGLLEIPPPASERPSVLAFSLRKAGSTLLYAILMGLCRKAELQYLSLTDQFWDRGIVEEEQGRHLGDAFRLRGYCYGGFRGLPSYPIPILERCQSVLLVRDPKDMLVSDYFSAAYSHGLPGGPADGPAVRQFIEKRQAALTLPIDDWVKRMLPDCRDAFAALHPLLQNSRVRLWRYEDVIFRKRAWVGEMVEHLRLGIGPRVQDAVAARYDLLPEQEDRNAHVRQVKPGNWRQHLSPGTAAHVDAALKDAVAPFGY